MGRQDEEQDSARPQLLVLRALGLGDLLVAVPALHALRRAFPNHRLLYACPEWLADAVELVGGYELLPLRGLDQRLPVRPGEVDIAVNLHGKGPQSTALLQAAGLRAIMAHRGSGLEGPEWVEDMNERMRWTRLMQWHGINADPQDVALSIPSVAARIPDATVIHVGAAFASRLWPAERFAMVARRLSDGGHRVVFTGNAEERRRAQDICRVAGLPGSAVLAGRLELREFAACIAGARLVISADTGAAHLASAYARPSVVLFGPVGPERWGPPGGPHLVLTRHGLRRGDPFADTPDPALLGVTVDDVLSAAAELAGAQ
ncbi:glycosyltransferase family 9 protein [Pseudarthrobacter sulfonivorans]|uniref:glycosyltransferase family 9 protein n=1 Tax=Pseudarthrobacter sulfonivorans TaxID=121292 RepID=UPI00285E2F0B|nr:ADP-heptose:LPS heptosyltransferase [Pseudarthrobacter sulfonivorans]